MWPYYVLMSSLYRGRHVDWYEQPKGLQAFLRYWQHSTCAKFTPLMICKISAPCSEQTGRCTLYRTIKLFLRKPRRRKRGRGIPPLIHNSILVGEVWLASIPNRFSGGEKFLRILNKRPSGPQSRDRRFGDETNCYRYREPNHSSSVNQCAGWSLYRSHSE